jgi:ribosomal-protein-alanine N-acetyltransferase
VIVRVGDACEVPADALAKLHASSFVDGWSPEEISRLLALPVTIGLAAHTHEPAGLMLGWVVRDEAEILTMAVGPDHRRRGVGRALLDAALEVASARGAAAIFLEVREDNEAARALYAQAGFTEAGRRQGYYSGVDALVLRRNLNKACE